MNELKLIGDLLLKLPPILPSKDSIGYWKPVGIDMVPGRKLCPEAVISYVENPKTADPTAVRMHLSYLGWKLEFNKDGGILRFRYTSPQDPSLRYLSLRKVCQDLRDKMTPEERMILEANQCSTSDKVVVEEHVVPEAKQVINICHVTSNSEEKVIPEAKQVINICHVTSNSECSNSDVVGEIIREAKQVKKVKETCDVVVVEEEVIPEAKQVINICHVSCNNECSNSDVVGEIIREAKQVEKVKETCDVVVVEEECCPQAVLDWYLYEPRKSCREGVVDVGEMKLRAKKHLSYLGWMLWKGNKGGRKELRYTSPSGVCYYSLRMACKACIEEGGGPSDCDLNCDSWLKKRKREEDSFLEFE